MNQPQGLPEHHLLVRSNYPGNGYKAIHVKGLNHWGLLCHKGPNPLFWSFSDGPLNSVTCRGCQKALERMAPGDTWPWTRKLAK